MSTTTVKPSLELDELGKFFTIAARQIDSGQAAPEMFSAAIDATWHQLLTDPAAHEAFAIQHAGRKLTHVEGKGSGFVSWVSAYEEAYGALPAIWFTDADGRANTEALAHYRETGQGWAEWDCGPVEGDDGDDFSAGTA